MSIVTNSLPKATHIGSLQFGNVKVGCCVLEDGTRLITQRGIYRALGRKSAGVEQRHKEHVDTGLITGLTRMRSFSVPQNIETYIEKEFARRSQLAEPIEFMPPRGPRALGYRAELLVEISNAYLTAAINGALQANQRHLVANAMRLIKAVSSVGITAIVDEATGYISEKAKDEYQQLLNRLLLGKPLPAERIIAKDFFDEVIRVWNVNPQCPGLAGVINNVLYRRLVPGLLPALKERNCDRYSNGQLKKRHTQYISDPDGRSAIVRHVEFTTLLLRGCDNREDAYQLLDRLLPLQ